MPSRLQLIAVSFAACVIGFSFRFAPAAEENPELDQTARPNFVYILCDDLRYDTFGFAGHPIVKTPNIDRLAAEGVRFLNAFVTTAICGPSRQNFFTGVYHDKAVTTTDGRRGRAIDFPKELQQAGYTTHEIGKMRGTGGYSPWRQTEDGKIHLTELIPKEAEKFLSCRDRDAPFCLSLGYVCTHAPFAPAKWTAESYQDAVFPIPKTRTRQHFDKLPALFKTSLNVNRYKKVFPPQNGEEKFQAFVRNYMRCVASIDRSVGKMLDLLDRHGVADETIVIFSSDHGFFLGEHGFGGKWLMHEPSIRIPMIVRAPAIPDSMRGKHRDEMVLSIDLQSTVLEAAGLKPRNRTDGRSFWTLVLGNQVTDWRTDFLYRFHFGKQIPSCEGVRTTDFKYIAYFDATDRQHINVVYEQLFDLENDPDESNNLASHDKHRERLDTLRARYVALRKKSYPDRKPPVTLTNDPSSNR